MHFAMIEKNISKKREYLSRNNRPEIGQPVRNRALNLTYSFRNYKETKKLQAMKLHALLTRSRSYIVAKFQLVSAVLS